MNEKKSRTVRINSLEEHKVLVKITTKPYATFITLLFVTIYISFSETTRIYGIVLTMLTLLLLVFTNDKTILTAADRFIVVYDQKNKEHGILIYLSEIVSWQYVITRKTEELILVLNDEEVIVCTLVMTKKMMRYLRDKMGTKEVKKEKGASLQ